MTPATTDRLLTLALPAAVERDLVDALRAMPDRVRGYSLFTGHGLGAEMRLATALEQVQGRAHRVFVQIALSAGDVDPVLAQLRAALPSPEIVFWVQPLLAFGHLA